VCVALCEQLAVWQKAYCKQEEPLGAFKCNVSTATTSAHTAINHMLSLCARYCCQLYCPTMCVARIPRASCFCATAHGYASYGPCHYYFSTILDCVVSYSSFIVCSCYCYYYRSLPSVATHTLTSWYVINSTHWHSCMPTSDHSALSLASHIVNIVSKWLICVCWSQYAYSSSHQCH
jgi:hypothetical protein